MNFFNLFFSIQTFPSIMIGTLIFVCGCRRKKHSVLKFLIMFIAFTVAAYYLWAYAKSTEVREAVGMAGIIACNVLFFVGCMAICLVCFDCAVTDSVYYVASGWTCQHLAGMITSLASVLFNVTINYFDYDWKYFTINVCSYVLVYIFLWFIFKKARKEGSVIQNRNMLIPMFIAFVCTTILNIYSPSEVNQAYIICKLYSVACCLLTLFLVYKAFENRILSNEIVILEELDRKKSEQYEISKESVDIINTRYHDLKKLLETLTSFGGTIPQKELDELKNEISNVDCVSMTGNEALDTVFTEKGNYCRKNNIELSVIVDIDDISFISDIELYSIFSNILDNAIEANMALKEGRAISVSVRCTNGFLIIHCDNPFSGEIKRDGDTIKTTKSNIAEHGFGIKSIKRSVAKYDGETSITADDGLFNIDIAIPLRSTAAA